MSASCGKWLLANNLSSISHLVFRFIFVALFLTSCTTSLTSKAPQPVPRPHTPKPTEDTPQPPRVIIAPSPFPKEANAKIVLKAWTLGDEVLKDFKSNGGAVSSAVAAFEIKLIPRTSTTLTLDGKIFTRSLSTLDVPVQFVGVRNIDIGGYRARLAGEMPVATYAAVLYFINLTDNTVLPLTFAITYEDRFNYGGYNWLEIDANFFGNISKFTPPTSSNLLNLFQDQVGKTFRVSPAVWFDMNTTDLMINQYAQHSALYKIDGLRSAVCASPTMQAMSDDEMKKKNLRQVLETFQADGALPPCLGLIQKR